MSIRYYPAGWVEPRQRSILAQRWDVVGSWVTLHVPSLGRILTGRVAESDVEALAVETELGLIRVRRSDCRPAYALTDDATG